VARARTAVEEHLAEQPATVRRVTVMRAHHIKRLPVVDADGELLTEILFADPAAIEVVVHDGLGKPGSQDHHDLIPVIIRLIWDIDGVVESPAAWRISC
jgi:CBS domain-containing protein